MLVVHITYAQDKTITGTVKDSDGVPLPGVTIQIKVATTGTQTDFDGNYSITAPEGSVLVYSYVGMTTVEKTVGESSTIDVTMKVNATELDDVVVTALGIKQEVRKLTYAAQDVKEEELNVTQNNNVNAAIAGKIAGVTVASQAGSKLGQSGAIRLRGAISATGTENPLYVVDGVVTSPEQIDPENIASINVLKGPNATALYGLRGNSGVLVITTKKGTTNSLKIEVFNSTTFDKVAYLPEYQNQYGQGYNGQDSFGTFQYEAGFHPDYWASFDGGRFNTESNADESWGPRFDGQDYYPWYTWFPDSPYFGQAQPWVSQEDNVKDFYDTGVTLKNGFTLSGGGENFTGRLNYTRQDQNGIIPNSTYAKNLINASFDVDLNDRLTIGMNLNYSNDKVVGDFADGYSNNFSGSFNSWFARDLEMDKLKELSWLRSGQDGTGYATSWNWWGPDYFPGTSGDNAYKKAVFWFNPYYWAEQYKPEDRNTRLVGDIHASYKLTDNINVNLLASRTSRNYDRVWKIPYEVEYSSAPAAYNDYVNSFGTRKYTSEENIIKPTIDFDFDLSEDFSLDGVVGGLFRVNKYTNTSSQMTQNGYPGGGDFVGLVIPDLYQFTNSRERVNPTYEMQKYRVNSMFGRVNFSYKNFLTLSGDLRSDYDSRYDVFNSGDRQNDSNRFTFGSIGASFVFSELIDNADFFDFGKLFVSYAEVGKEIDAYQVNPPYRLSSNTYGSNPLMYAPSSAIGSGIEPATSGSLEVGINTAFFQNRVRLNATYYNEDREREILNLDLPTSTGYSSIVTNGGLINREGLEITLGLTPVKTTDFTWDMNINFSTNKTMVKELEGLDAYAIASSTYSYVTLTNVVGEEWGQLVGAAIARDENGTPILNSNGTYVSEAGHNYGSILPDFNGGIFNSFSYKGLTLAGTLTFQKGGKFFSLSESWGAYSGLLEETAATNDLGNNVRDDVASGGGVHSVGVDVDGNTVDQYYPAYNWFGQYYSNRLAEPFVHDASYLKLNELSLSYTLPKNLIGEFMESASIGFVARNVALLALSKDNVHNWDPSELSQVYGENGQLPGTRSYGFNVKFTF